MSVEKMSLLDMMAAQMGCEYLSDLRYLDSGQRAQLARKLKKLPTQIAGLRDWNDALEYLTGDAHSKAEARQARDALIAGLTDL